MKAKVVTIGTLLDKGLINKSTKVKISAKSLKELHLIKPLPKGKVEKITLSHLKHEGMLKE